MIRGVEVTAPIAVHLDSALSEDVREALESMRCCEAKCPVERLRVMVDNDSEGCDKKITEQSAPGLTGVSLFLARKILDQ
jgi:hypothetical protein